jgi:hypothetical protein
MSIIPTYIILSTFQKRVKRSTTNTKTYVDLDSSGDDDREDCNYNPLLDENDDSDESDGSISDQGTGFCELADLYISFTS